MGSYWYGTQPVEVIQPAIAPAVPPPIPQNVQVIEVSHIVPDYPAPQAQVRKPIVYQQRRLKR